MDVKFKRLKTKILTIQDSSVFKRYNKAKAANSNRNTMSTLIRTDTTDNALSTLPDLDTTYNANEEAQQCFDWIEESKQEQQEFYSLLGDRKWDIIMEADVALLVRKVAFGIYGPPTRLPNESLNTEGCDNADSNQTNLNAENNNENSEGNESSQENSGNSRQNENSGDDIGYTAEQMKVIKQMCTTIQEHGKYRDNPKGIRFACIFICGKTAEDKFTVPVFKTLKLVKDGVEQDVFIDTNFRVYSNWAHYLKSNTLPPCHYCYPRNGTYTGSVRSQENDNARNGNNNDSSGSDDDNNEANPSEVHIEYGMSPASSKSAKVLSAVDRVATYVTWGATVVAVAGMCTVPIAGPIAAAATVGGLSSGAYVAGRSGFSLYDRKSHAQTISVKDTEARNCWLTVVGGTLGFAQARMITHLAKAAEIGKVTGVASRAGQISFLMVNVGCISVSGLGILSNFAGLLEKKEKKELTKLDILQFSASCLFFTHSLVTFKTAQSIIKEVQNDVIDSHRQGMAGKKYRNQRNKFNKKLKKNVSENGELHGNANVVKSINNIRSTKDFYKALAEPEHPETEIHLNSQSSVEEFHDASINANEEVVPTVISKPKPSPKNSKSSNSVQKEKKAGSGSASKPSPSLRSDNQNVNGKSATNIKSNTIVKRQFTIDAKTKLLILSKAQLLAKGMIDSEEFQTFMKDLYKKCEPKIKAAISKLCEVFRAAKIEEIEINGYRVFRKLSQLDMQKLARFLVDAIQIYGPDVMMLVSMLAKLLKCNNSEEFFKCLVMTCLFVQKKFFEYEGRYQRGEFDFDFFGKPEERVQYYQNQIYSAFEGEPNQIEASLTELNNFVQEQQDEEFLHGSSSNSTSQNGIDVLEGNQVQNVLEIPSFMTEIESSSSNTENVLEECDSQKGNKSSSCLSFCLNYNDFDSDGYGNLCEDQYLQIVSEMLNLPLRGDTIFEYAGDITFMYFSSPMEVAAYGVKIEKVGEQDNYFGIVTVLNE